MGSGTGSESFTGVQEMIESLLSYCVLLGLAIFCVVSLVEMRFSDDSRLNFTGKSGGTGKERERVVTDEDFTISNLDILDKKD